VPGRTFGQSCSSTQPCNSNYNFTCKSGSCVCNAGLVEMNQICGNFYQIKLTLFKNCNSKNLKTYSKVSPSVNPNNYGLVVPEVNMCDTRRDFAAYCTFYDCPNYICLCSNYTLFYNGSACGILNIRVF
jgi:hypothetical protein